MALQLFSNYINTPHLLWNRSLATGTFLINLLYKQLCRKPTWSHDDVMEWKLFSRYWPFVRGIHRSPVNSPHKGQWRGALMSSLLCAWINAWENNREAGDLRRHRAHCDVTVMSTHCRTIFWFTLSASYFDSLCLQVINCHDIVYKIIWYHYEFWLFALFHWEGI